ncbi:MAG: hypothetical protein JF616_01460 [Fibrobacteres bacterium]|nr:hypothetical protein [Fibrobacterota bacterium]
MIIRLLSSQGLRALGWLALAAAAAAPASAIDLKISSPIFGRGVIFKSNGNVQPEGRIFTNVPLGDTWPIGGSLYVNAAGGGESGAFVNNDLFLKGIIKTFQSSFPGRTRFKKADGTVMASIDDAGNLYVKGAIEDVSLCVAPVTEFAKWNTNPFVQSENNCYNYANNQATFTFATPGLASGAPETDDVVSQIRTAALNDGLTWVGWNFPGNGYTCPNAGTLVFMTVAPHVDYHWYRLDKANGKWTHKISDSPATDLDAGHNIILNPLTANRNYGVHNYTDNGGFYCTCGGDANVR